MKRLLLALVLLYTGITAHTQPLGNEWIDPGRTHYKIKVAADGMYRIPFSTLAATIPNISSLNPRNLIMYHHGQPVPIYISTNGNFTANDYIEFYGNRPSGEIDSLLYRSANQQLNPYFSLFPDSSSYYLTTNNLINNPRLSVVPNDLTNLPPKEEYFMHLSIDFYPCGGFYSGKYYSVGNDEVYKPLFEEGEGFTSCSYFGSTPQTFNINTPFLYTNGPNARFITRYTNNSPNDNHIVHVKVGNYDIFPNGQRRFGFQLNPVDTSIPVSELTSGNNIISYYDQGSNNSFVGNMVGSLALRYPRQYNFGGASQFYFRVAASPTTKYLEIDGFKDNGTQPILYDLTNGLVYRSALPAGSTPVKFHILQSGVEREMFLRADASSAYQTITQLTPINFIDYSNIANQGEYYIISHSKLFNDGTGTNWVDEYRKYRDMNENPGIGLYHNARIADVELLYDQFGYGIRKSPLGIRNFIRYATSQWADSLKYVFLIGKGREYTTYRTGSGAAFNQCLIPTFGSPASDNLLAATRTSDMPLAAIGRLAAETPKQVKDYLDKIKAYETEQRNYTYNQPILPKIWQKQVLHFSGGTSAFEQSSFLNYNASYALIAKDTLWGARVTSFSKTSNAPIDQSVSQIIKEKINNGVSWITFFGHSATGAFDFSIDEPENYTNAGKYPIILSNGCFSGFIHDATRGYSERFVLAENKGAIAFMATSSLSVSSGLHDFSYRLYSNFNRPTYYQSLGKSVQKTLKDLYTCCSANNFAMMVAYEMTLHGDPGIWVNQYPKPDYAIDQTSVFFNPTTVIPGTDSFDVKIVVTNLGKAINDSIVVTLKRTIEDAQRTQLPPYIYRQLIKAPYYQDTITFKLPVNISTLGYGLNLFEPYVDADFGIDEMAEGNNGLLSPVSLNIQSDDIIPVYPYEFAIVPKQGVTLKASTINPFAPLRTYKFEIDTSELFVSPLQTGRITQSGGVVHWQPGISYIDSTVYYWRVAKDSAGASWHYSSFIYLKDEYPGWNQSHFFQWQKDNYFNLNLDSNDRIFKFPPTLNQIHVRTGVANAVGGNVDFETMGWDYNNANMYRFRMGGCGFLAGITFAVINPVTGENWTSVNANGDNLGDKFNNAHCGFQYYLQNGFDFYTTGTGASETIKRFIDSIPCNYYVLVYSDNRVPYTGWDSLLVTTLQSIGMQAQLFKNGTINGPFTFFGQKCSNSYTPFFAYKNGYTIPLDTSFTFFGPWNQGNFISPKIGPAESWGSVHWQHQPLNGIASDADTLDIIGEKVNGIDTILFSTTIENNFINQVSAQQYPYIKLRLRTKDDTNRTPTQPVYLRVLYKKPPEAAINPAAHFVISDSVSIGQKLHMEIALENLTEVPMDSMLTKYSLRDATLNSQISYVRYDSLRSLDTMIMVYDMQLDNNGYQGLNRLIIEANPDNDQIEQYHFNNIAEIGFTVGGDRINPLLDVTFDNQHIMSGDIVSAKPTILITLKDENKYLPLDDTSLIDVYLKYPGETAMRRMSYDDIIMKFYPADSSNLARVNKAQVELKPYLTMDGTYELIVKDKDRSGNNSSTTTSRYEGNNFYDYKTTFEVINKPMITNVLNYPNPFTTSTKFVFTITGTEVPDFMKVQIMTIKGTVVKELMKEELGPLHIGRNMTEYAWDGRDQYGDQLANGVYFYRVVTRLDNKQMDHLGEGYDKYFKKGFGKMVIIR